MARDWIALPVYQSELEVPQLPAGWTVRQVESIYEPVEAGPRHEQRTISASGTVPVVHQGANGYLGFHNNVPGVAADAADPVVTFANHTCEMRLMRQSFSVIQNVFPMRGRLGVCYTDFLYYATKGRIRLTEYKGHHPDFRRMWIPLPPLSEQRAIAEVLGALDDKIEANRRIEGLATEIALAQATSALEHVGGTPTDMEQIADITKGVSYRSDDLIPGDGWLVSLKCVGRDGSFEPRGLKPFSGPAKPGQVVDDGDVLVAQTDLTQRGEVIGRPIRVQRLGLAGRFVASLDFAVVRPRPPLTRELLFGLLSQRVFREHALGFCNGTTVLHMNSRALPSYQVAIPEAEQGRRLTNIMKPLFECSAVARLESSALGQLRDTLLPKLLSGELRVRDAESLVGEAV